MGTLATLSGSQAEAYNFKDARPTYPNDWYKMLANKIIHHELAWDVGTGNGQAALGLSNYYRRVVATDINKEQLKLAKKNPKITYYLTEKDLSVDALVALVGGDNSVDLITAAQAVHYFDLNKFYAVVKRVLRKPGGVIAVWVFNQIDVSPDVNRVFERLADSTIPFRTPETEMSAAGYRSLPFPFKSVGIGSEENPVPLDLKKELSLEGYLAYLKTWQLVVRAKQQGVDLLNQRVINDIIRAWGNPNQVKTVVYKFFMIAGSCESGRFEDSYYYPPRRPPQMNSLYGHMPPPPPPPPSIYGHMPSLPPPPPPPPPSMFSLMPPQGPPSFQYCPGPPPPCPSLFPPPYYY